MSGPSLTITYDTPDALAEEARYKLEKWRRYREFHYGKPGDMTFMDRFMEFMWARYHAYDIACMAIVLITMTYSTPNTAP